MVIVAQVSDMVPGLLIFLILSLLWCYIIDPPNFIV